MNDQRCDITEQWRAVLGYEGLYEVSDLGRVRRNGKIRKPFFNREVGAVQLMLCKDGIQKQFKIHRLVLQAFRGPCQDGMEACHDPDPDQQNNRLSNLRWDTKSSNMMDRVKHYGGNRGERHPRAKISRFDVERIFDLKAGGCSEREVASWIGISRRQIRNILTRKNWAHVGV